MNDKSGRCKMACKYARDIGMPEYSCVGECVYAEKEKPRRQFNRWFQQYADSDGKFTHMPRWLKADLWEAWQAGRATLKDRTNG